jgi:hypothetical protein
MVFFPSRSTGLSLHIYYLSVIALIISQLDTCMILAIISSSFGSLAKI